MKQQYNTALYMRLSRDDDTFGDSVSIDTQRTILRKYAQDNGLHVVDEYVDDGWSGTNFDRPSFQRMMDDVDAGKINCIVTKDLSRFGREHIQMGHYLEFVFPQKQVRYIAIAENEDTEKGLSEFVPFKNLFNEWFAKDTSRKVKTALQTRFAQGERMCAYAPLGYIKHPEKKNALAVDEEYKWIIEKIFDLAVHGNGSGRITKILRDEKIPTPGYLNYIRYGTFAHIYKDAPEEKSYAWTCNAVKCILKDETYIGNTIHNKQTNISYKNKKKIRKPEEEWLRIEGTHEAIISKEVFEQVQGQIASRRRETKDATTQIFAGIIKCSDCGYAMSYGTNSTKKKKWNYYCCTNYRQLGKKHSGCTGHYIRYDVLYPYVLSRIQTLCAEAQFDDEKLLEKILKATDKERNSANKRQNSELKKAERRKNEVDRLFMKLYEDWSSERITEYNFNMMSQKYQAEQEELLGKIEQLKQTISEQEQNVTGAEKWVELIKQYAHPTELTAELLNALIEKIVVHEAETDDFGIRAQEVEIYYRFIGKID